MAAAFVDLDGTTFLWGTNRFIDGVLSQLNEFYRAGNQLIFVTMRGENWPLSKEAEKVLKNLFPNSVVLFKVDSPRLVVNDQGALAVSVGTDQPWPVDINRLAINIQS